MKFASIAEVSPILVQKYEIYSINELCVCQKIPLFHHCYGLSCAVTISDAYDVDPIVESDACVL